MPVQLPYLVSYKNVGKLFESIASAKIPETFNRDFLQTTIGLKGSNDRALIPLLRNLGFIDQSGSPTNTYRLLKGEKRQGAIGQGLRKAYASLFDADQDVYKVSSDKLKNLISQVAGTDDLMTTRIAGTFNALAKLGDFSEDGAHLKPKPKENGGDDDDQSEQEKMEKKRKGLRTEFHYNIQIHLPSNATEEIYLNIFNALRKTFE